MTDKTPMKVDDFVMTGEGLARVISVDIKPCSGCKADMNRYSIQFYTGEIIHNYPGYLVKNLTEEDRASFFKGKINVEQV